MTTLLTLALAFSLPLLLVGAVGVRVALTHLKVPSHEKVMRYAKTYLKRNPEASERKLRDACVWKFVPEPDDDKSWLGSGAIFGVGGMAGVFAGKWFNRQMYDYHRRATLARIDRVLDDLYDD